MIKIVFCNKNALNTIAKMTPILYFTSVYILTLQDQPNAIYHLWPKRLLMFVIYVTCNCIVICSASLHG